MALYAYAQYLGTYVEKGCWSSMYSSHYSKLQNGRHVMKQMKNAVTLERSLLREIHELKIFAFSTKPIAVIKVLYKQVRKWRTHTEYCNYPLCACVPSVNYQELQGF